MEHHFKRDKRTKIKQENLDVFNYTRMRTMKNYIFWPLFVSDQVDYLRWYMRYFCMLIENSQYVTMRVSTHDKKIWGVSMYIIKILNYYIDL